MDSSLLIAAGASFVVGVAGYIIVRFWIKPISRYGVAKRRVNRELNRYLSQADDSVGSKKKGAPKKASPGLRNARKETMTLVTCYNDEIPYWYRLLLDSREESPADALGLISHLSKLRDPDNIKDQVDKARKKLGLK